MSGETHSSLVIYKEGGGGWVPRYIFKTQSGYNAGGNILIGGQNLVQVQF